MADVSKTIEIIFGAVDNTGSGLSSVSRNLTDAANSASSITEPLANVAAFALKAETAVLALAAAYGGYAMQKASEFENAQIDLNKVLSAGEPGIESFTKTVTDLSEQYGVSSAAILQGIANFKQAGFTAEESSKLQKDALDLMIAGDVDAARASEILVSSIKGFGAEAGAAARYVEALNNVSNDYATDVEQLAEGMSRVAPILKTMGFSFEEGTGLLTPMIEVFRDGGQAAEALKTGLLKLVDDAKPVTEALAALGVSQFDLNGKMRSGKDIFYDVAKAFESVDQNQKLVFAGQLFGIEQAPKLVTVFDNLAKVNEITAAAMKETGSAAKEVDLRLASTAKQADIFKTSFDNLAISVGTGLNAQFKDVIAGSGDVLQSFKQIVDSGGLAPFFEALKPQVAAFSATLENIAANLPAAFENVDFSGLLSALKDLGFEIGGIFDGIDLNTPEGLATAIQFVVDSLDSLTTVTAGVISAWSPLVAEFVAGIKAFNDLDDSSKKTFGSVSGLGQIFETFKGILTGGFGAIDVVGKSLSVIAGIKAAETLLSISGAIKGMEFAGAISALEKFSGLLALPTSAVAIAAIAAVGFAVKENTDAWSDYKDRQQSVADSTASLTASQSEISSKLKDISSSTGIAIGSMDELNKAVNDGRLVFNDATGAYEAAGTGVRNYDAEVASAAGSGSFFADAVNSIAASLGLAGDAADDAVGSFGTLAAAEAAALLEMDKGRNTSITFADGLYTLHSVQKDAAKSSDELSQATKNAADAAKTGSQEWKRVQEVLLETQKQSDEFTIKLGELANKKYEIDVKANVDIKTAEIEAQTQRIQAAFTAVSDVIASLAPEVTNLWALFSDKAGFVGSKELELAAKRMEDRLDRELELKTRITEASVENLNAKTDRLRNGDALISIDSGDLAPELDSLFEKILQRVQIKGTEEGLNLLLGLGAD